MNSRILHAFTRAFALVLTVPLTACGGGGVAELPGPVDDPLAAAAQTITSEDMITRIGVLAHDSMRGRDTPSPGLEMAARYIVDSFRRMGLEGGAEGGEFIQRFPFPLIGLDTAGVALELSGAENLPSLVFGEDFVVSPGEVQSLTAPLVYVGPATAFADARPAAASLAGLLPLANLPGEFNRATQVAINRARAAAQVAGAQAILFALSADVPDATFAQLHRFLSSPRRTLGGITDLTVVLLRQPAAARILAAGGTRLEGPLGTPTAASPVPIGDLRASLAAPLQVAADDEAPNVIAILRGGDPELADEYVVFSAHMDHVGVGRPDETGDSIYNGADDDASGTSAIIEVAEAFTNLLERPRRSLVFLLVSGEEKGLLGSRWFSEHPTVPLENIVANINVDMIGRNAPDTIVVIGQEFSSLGPTVHGVAARNPQLGLTVAEDPWPEERFFFRSDHFNFARKEIPAIFFFAGVHEDYHQPSDEVEKIDEDKAARVARLIFYTAHAIADAVPPPTWTEEGLEQIRMLTAGGR
ncbi:MAG TPA: M20/M25/M40 family metallo-hydrolase [Longimicrobiales bacterium]|nr:M20/M25/M40 family metallo-hydrolase [Longimicrobiales bacterium]